MNTDHRFHLENEHGEELIVTIMDDFQTIRMEVEIDGETAEVVSMTVDEWIATIMRGEI
jgi:hypothetical protein